MAEDIADLAIKLSMDDASFSQGVQSLKRDLSIIDSGFKESISGLKDWGKNVDSLKNNASALGEKIEAQNQIVQKYQSQLEKTKQSLEENSEKMLELKDKVAQAKTAWEESAESEGKNSEATQSLKKQYEELSQEYDRSEQKVMSNSKSVDGYTIQLNKQQGKLKEMQSELSNTQKKILEQNSTWLTASKTLDDSSKKLKTVGEGFTSVGETANTHFTLPIVAGLGLAAKSGADFEHQMADIRKELVASGESTNDVDSLMKQMSSDSLKWSEDFGQSTDDINAGLLTFKKDGYSGKEAIDDMNTSLYTARGANEDLTDVINTLGGSLEAYGMKTNNAAENTQNMSHIADSFAYISNHTKANVTSLGEAFSITGQTASALKQPMEDTAAAIGELQSSNIDASTAADSLKAGLVNLTKPTAKMSAAMKEMKLSVFDAKGQMKDLPTILDEVNDHTKTWTNQQKQAAIATIFGKESLASWNVLLNKGGDNLRQLSDGAKNSTGEVQRLSDSMKNTPVNQLKELEGSVKALGVSIGEYVLPTFIPLVKDVTGAVKAFGNLDDGTKKTIVTLGLVVAAVGPVSTVIGKTASGISLLEKGLSKVTKFIGNKSVEDALKNNTKAEGENTESVATNTEALEVNSKAEAGNAEATELNTKAKETNSKVNGNYKSTLDDLGNATENSTKKTGEAAETVEDLGKTTAETAEKTGTAGKAVGELAETAGETAGKAGIAATAVEGLGSAAGAAGAGLGAAGGGAAAFGTTMASLAAPVAIGVAAIAATGAAIYGVHYAITEKAVPSMDLFNSKYQTTEQTMDQYGDKINETVTKTVKFSDATKQAVGSYMQMDDNVKKTMTDIYVNSNNFSTKSKNTIISQYTDMANKVKGLTGDQKDKVITDFSNMVTNTGSLTTQNKSKIIAQYTDMVSKVSGLSNQQKQQVIKSFSDTLTQSTGVTNKQVSSVVNQFNAMGTKIKSGMDTQYNSRLSTIKNFFAKSDALTATDEQKVLQNMQNSNNKQKGIITSDEQKIASIYANASNQHRQLKVQEQAQIDQLEDNMKTHAITSLSDTSIQSKVLLERMKSYGTNITEQQASSIIQNANKQRDGAVAAANDQYNKTVANFVYQRDVTHSMTADQAEKCIKDAGKQRDQSIQAAKEQRTQVVDHLSKMGGEAVKNMDTDTGNMLSPWDKFKQGVEDKISDLSKWLDKHPLVAKIAKGAESVVSGLAGFSFGGFAGGTDDAPKGWSWVGEKGPELMWFDGGEKVIPHNDSQKIVQQTLQTSGSAPAITADDTKLKTTETYGENLNVNFGKGLTNSLDYATNPLNDMTAKLNSTMNTTATKYISYGKKNIQNLGQGITQNSSAATSSLGTLTDTLNNNMSTFSTNAINHGLNMDTSIKNGINNKSNDVVTAQQNLTNTVGNNLNNFATNAINYGTHTDNSIQNGLQNSSGGIYSTISNMTSTVGNSLQSFASGCTTYGNEIVTTMVAGIQSQEGNLTNVVTDLTNKVIQAFQQGFDIHSPSRKTFWLGTMLPEGLIKGIKSKDLGNFINKWLNSITGGVKSVGGNIAGILSAALAIDGEPLSWLPALEMIASRESGTPGALGTGDASLVNSVGVGGEYATGLMQMLPSTFASYAKAGMNTISNGLDNAVAAVRYIVDRYKTPYAIPNWNNSNYGGYSTGTESAIPGWAWVGENGPELMKMSGGEQIKTNEDSLSMVQKFKDMLNSFKDPKVYIPSTAGATNSTVNNVTNNYGSEGKNGGVTINLDHVTVNGYKDVKKLMRDAYNIQVNYQKGKGAV